MIDAKKISAIEFKHETFEQFYQEDLRQMTLHEIIGQRMFERDLSFQQEKEFLEHFGSKSESQKGDVLPELSAQIANSKRLKQE